MVGRGLDYAAGIQVFSGTGCHAPLGTGHHWSTIEMTSALIPLDIYKAPRKEMNSRGIEGGPPCSFMSVNNASVYYI